MSGPLLLTGVRPLGGPARDLLVLDTVRSKKTVA